MVTFVNDCGRAGGGTVWGSLDDARISGERKRCFRGGTAPNSEMESEDPGDVSRTA